MLIITSLSPMCALSHAQLIFSAQLVFYSRPVLRENKRKTSFCLHEKLKQDESLRQSLQTPLACPQAPLFRLQVPLARLYTTFVILSHHSLFFRHHLFVSRKYGRGLVAHSCLYKLLVFRHFLLVFRYHLLVFWLHSLLFRHFLLVFRHHLQGYSQDFRKGAKKKFGHTYFC